MDPVEERYERERSYHDDRYADDPRTVTGKYYAIDGGKARYQALLASVGSGKRVLEYGCGTGSAAFGLAEAGADVVGIDISPVAIDEAREEATRRRCEARFVEMNAEALEFDDDSFDVVCGTGVLHHLDLERAFAEIARVLRADGWAAFVEPLAGNPAIGAYRSLTPKLRTPDEHPLVAHDFESARRHFEHVEDERFNLVALLGVLLVYLPGGRRLLPRLHAADQWLFRRSGLARRWAWVTVLQLRSPRG